MPHLFLHGEVTTLIVTHISNIIHVIRAFKYIDPLIIRIKKTRMDKVPNKYLVEVGTNEK